MLNKDKILTDLYQSKFIDDLIWTITSGHQLKADLKAELFLILCEMDDNRIITAYQNNYLHYLCVNIVKKQYHSNSSPFHTKWRKDMGSMYDGQVLVIDEIYQSESHYNWNSPLEIQQDSYTFPDEIIDKIIWFVDNKLDLVDRELFKIYYKFDRYERWHGDLRDTTCQKQISSLRKVKRKLAITSIDGGCISIGHDTIRLSLDRSIMRIKHYLKENDLDI